MPFPRSPSSEAGNAPSTIHTAEESSMPFYSTETIENVQLSTGNPGEYKPPLGGSS